MKKDELITKLKQWFTNEQSKQKNKTMFNAYFYMIIGIGVFIMLLSNLTSTFQENDPNVVSVDTDYETAEEEVAAEPSHPSSIVEYEKYYETQMKEILSDVIGVSNVSVKVNVASTERKIHEKDRRNEKQVTEERDQEGGTRTIESQSLDEQVIITNDGERDQPVVIASEKPQVTGVIVVAQGAEQLQVKQQIIEAVTRFFHVPSHQVSVLPKKIKED